MGMALREGKLKSTGEVILDHLRSVLMSVDLGPYRILWVTTVVVYL